MEQKLLQAVWPTWLTVIGQIMQYFAMVSGALFVPYLVIQKCRQAATTTSAGATYNYLTQAAPAQAAVTTTSFQQAIAVGGATSEATPAAPHQEALLLLRVIAKAPLGDSNAIRGLIRAKVEFEAKGHKGKDLMKLLIVTHRLWTPSRMAQFVRNI